MYDAQCLFPDRCELKEAKKASAIQEKMIYCLQHLLNVRHGGPKNMLYKIFDFMTDVRDLSEFEQTFAQELTQNNLLNRVLKNYALIREMLT